jgi:environmental stress-induced protein Ves
VIRVLAPHNYRVMPWKNGGGTTTEIYIHPNGADWDDFDWRVGIADIARSGTFSSFPGIDRSIMLLDCPERSGMRLTIDGVEFELPLHRFVRFAGEATTTGALLGAPVRDFNVMSRRANVRHVCGIEVLAARDTFEPDGSGWKFVYVVDGACSVECEDQPVTVEANHSLVADAESSLRVRSVDRCRIVWSTFASSQ